MHYEIEDKKEEPSPQMAEDVLDKLAAEIQVQNPQSPRIEKEKEEPKTHRPYNILYHDSDLEKDK
jgi:hypothetical protein